MKIGSVLLCATALLSGLPAPARSEDIHAKKWTDKAQVSYLSANGNTKSSTLGASNEFEYKWTHLSMGLNAGGLGTQSQHVITAEQYYANEKLAVNLTARNYAFERAGWDKSRFSGIANRVDSSLGLGRELLKTSRNDLILELGGGFVNEQRIASERQSFASGRAYGKYVHTISPTGNFSQDAEYLHNFKRSQGYRVNTETALVSAMSTHMSLKVSYVVKYLNEPAPGFGKTDTMTAAALIFNY
jgi:putative salt-induced outer membrane protein